MSQLDAVCKFILLSPPKCGTHLIIKALTGITEKKETTWLGDMPADVVNLTEQVTAEGGFAVAHNWDLPTLLQLVQRGYKIVFILRDPRDHAISILDWSYKPNWGGPEHILKIANRDERLIELIAGTKGWSCYEFIKNRLKLLTCLPKTSIYIARFENLVGPKGGGSKEKQLNELRSLSKFLESEISEKNIEKVAARLWGNSPTFSIGKIGRWREEMTPFHIHIYKSIYQDELIYLKYETGREWSATR